MTTKKRISRIPRAMIASLFFAAAPPTVAAAVLSVTTLADIDAADGHCSLREAIVAANTDAAYRECPAGAGSDLIDVVVPGTITLAADLPRIEEGLGLLGLGAGVSVIDGAQSWEIVHYPGAAAPNGELLRIEDLELTGGSATEGGAVFLGHNRALRMVNCLLVDNRSTLAGGAIFADDPVSIEIRRSSLLANTAGTSGGGLAIELGADVTVVDSTFAGNVAESGRGGAISALATGGLVVLQSTISDNSATTDGGGVAAVASPLRLESSTVVGNTADTDDDNNGDGGGLSVAGSVTATLVNSILAENLDGTSSGINCPDGQHKLAAAMVTEGFNLIGANECMATPFPSGQPNVNGDFAGTAAATLEALLEPLDDNGGPTWTRLPMATSPAVDQGACPGVTADQRFFGDPATGLRLVDDPATADLADGCDIGAAERGGVSVAPMFADDFERGTTRRWSTVVP